MDWLNHALFACYTLMGACGGIAAIISSINGEANLVATILLIGGLLLQKLHLMDRP